jgi:hypothetical protein
MIKLGAWSWPWLVVAGCYDPDYHRPTCSAKFGCPDGMRCNASSLVCEDANLPCTSFSSQFDTCTLPPAADLVIEGEASFDTASLQLFADGSKAVARMTLHTQARDVGAILAHDVRIAAGATLVASGNAPMAIVASGRITIEAGASIDVSASFGDVLGGAGSTLECVIPAGPGDLVVGRGGGGGGGGGFNGRGGAGGDSGDDGGGGVVHGGNGAGSIDAPVGPQGGCRGADGERGRGGRPGVGGGAMYLVAAFQIDIGADARLMAVGSGGFACGSAGACGGGGGGSGGMIMLEAPRIVAPHAKLSANGGGGGGGGSEFHAGLPGSDGTDSTERAGRGAAGGADATPGGFGGSRLVAMGDDVTTPAAGGGGGGGGGGAGYIIVVSQDSQLSDGASPEPIVRAAGAR